MRIGILAFASAGLLAVIACGGSSTNPSNSSTTADRTQIADYQDLTARVQSAALSYRATMGASAMTVTGCSAAHDAYDAQVRPWISQMVQLSGAMDGFIGAHDGVAYVDMSCVASAMLAELDAHRRVACTFSSLTDDQAEAFRHADVMASYSAHVYARCGQMMSGLDGYGYGWGPMANGCGGGPGVVPGPSGDPVALGERIFDWGIGADGQPIVRSGGFGMMMMTRSGCAGCHGSDGHGLRTMMFTTPNITYPNLTDPSGLREPDGTRGPTYTDELIRRAVAEGVGADGETLDPRMPRWQLSGQDWDDLLLFLKTLR
ncbi:c-type cytochrome [Anaeromyxobacter sp. SG17]|uniref:c-type cytochrome n=2 Tax=unclassified Anaeromyxobacter TaxID=2620896 RepID=UPI001F592DA3|nr:c-type cytochrome [Anaeromyxobacter sp. SG17]